MLQVSGICNEWLYFCLNLYLYVVETAEHSDTLDDRQIPYDIDSKRVYVNNLSWSVRWQDLKDHMREAGHVTRAEVCCIENNIL